MIWAWMWEGRLPSWRLLVKQRLLWGVWVLGNLALKLVLCSAHQRSQTSWIVKCPGAVKLQDLPLEDPCPYWPVWSVCRGLLQCPF